MSPETLEPDSAAESPPESSDEEEHLRFERLISDLSVRVVSATAETLDDTIEMALGRLGRHLRLGLATVLCLDSKRNVFTHTHEWYDEELFAGSSFLGTDIGEPFFWVAESLAEGRDVLVSTLDDLPPDAEAERKTCEALAIRSVLWVPFWTGEQVTGYVAFNSIGRKREWTIQLVQRVRLIGEIVGGALERRDQEGRLREAYDEISRLKSRLEAENVTLRREIRQQAGQRRIVGESAAVQEMLTAARQVAPTDSTVLLLGETGTGKELLAQAIHAISDRRKRALVRINCGALPPTLIESELFGRQKGAYTGALTQQKGRFEVADGSTILLDEIAELPLELQPKLLEVLETGRFERLGSTKTVQVDVRVIAATNRDLERRVEEGGFREDLYFRLNVFPIRSAPLRERTGDIPLLVWTFVREFSETMGKSIDSVPQEHLSELQRYSWPGNVRELRNLVERAMIRSTGPVLEIEIPGRPQQQRSASLKELERNHISEILKATGWRVRGAGGAAEILGLKPTTLDYRMKKLGIQRPR